MNYSPQSTNAAQYIVLGLWPIAGITTVGVTPENARATIAAALDCGIRSFDTAFSYGYDGESDRYLGQAIHTRRDDVFIIGKVGQRYATDRNSTNRTRVVDASPAALIADAELSLSRIGIEYFDLLMLHSVDASVPLETSAAAIDSLCERGLCKTIGVCNVDRSQYQRFAAAVGCDAIQCPLNIFQRHVLSSLVPACRESASDVYVYWTLMKGLLAGRISRDHVFAAGDSRPGYAIFQGPMRAAVHNALDQFAKLAAEAEITLPELSIGWVLSQAGITAALVGAHHPDQVAAIAHAQPLPPDLLVQVDRIAQHSGLLTREM